MGPEDEIGLFALKVLAVVVALLCCAAIGAYMGERRGSMLKGAMLGGTLGLIGLGLIIATMRPPVCPMCGGVIVPGFKACRNCGSTLST